MPSYSYENIAAYKRVFVKYINKFIYLFIYLHIQKVVGKICYTIEDNLARHILDIIPHNNDWCHL